MSIDRDFAIAILKLTKNGPISHKLINKEVRISSQVAERLLRKLQNDGLINVQNSILNLDSIQRVRLAVYCVGLGADLELASNFLQWQEFESIVTFILEQNGYSVSRNVRFKHGGRKWEMDVVGCRKPLALCIDCKRWHHGIHQSSLKRIIEEQVKRTKALAESLPNPTIKTVCASWEDAKFTPIVLSLITSKLKFYDDVPVVPILQLQDFISQLPAYAQSLKHFLRMRHDFQDRFG
ncbi:Lrp/AsnC family transcriptional regulator [Candidatus Bathyarchaeota archaeon]|nr:Lrp/AsnC family transcriptional regulator [Candidatus Bathyarchaeota archaeon]